MHFAIALYRSFAVKAVRRETGRKRVATRAQAKGSTDRASERARACDVGELVCGLGRAVPSSSRPPHCFLIPDIDSSVVTSTSNSPFENDESGRLQANCGAVHFSAETVNVSLAELKRLLIVEEDGFGADVSQSCGETSGKWPASSRRPTNSLLGHVAPKGQFFVNSVGSKRYTKVTPVAQCGEQVWYLILGFYLCF